MPKPWRLPKRRDFILKWDLAHETTGNVSALKQTSGKNARVGPEQDRACAIRRNLTASFGIRSQSSALPAREIKSRTASFGFFAS